MDDPVKPVEPVVPPWHIADSPPTEPAVPAPPPSSVETPVPAENPPPLPPNEPAPVELPPLPFKPEIPAIPEPTVPPVFSVPTVPELPKKEEMPLPPPPVPPPSATSEVLGFSANSPAPTGFKKEKKSKSAGKTVLTLLLFLLLAVGGALGYMSFQKGGLPFNLGKKAVGSCPAECPNKCDVTGACNPACCVSGGDCPSGQSCDIPNGYCQSGKSCNDQGSGFHKACVDQQCVNVPGIGSDQCSSHDQCYVAPPPVDACAGLTQCPGGTKDCPTGNQCMRTGNEQCPNVCKPTSNPLGCCSGDSQCASWESCSTSNGACPSGKSCGSHAGCAIDSDCANGGVCIGGTCQGVSGNIVCEATKDGVKITNTTNVDISGTVEWFSKKCSDNGGTNCACTGAPATESFSVLKSGGTWSKAISGSGCAWQSDVKVKTANNPIAIGCNNANSGCIAGCTTPTVPVPTKPVPTVTEIILPTLPVCSLITINKTDKNTGDIFTTSQFAPGDTVLIDVQSNSGSNSANNTGTIAPAEAFAIRIKKDGVVVKEAFSPDEGTVVQVGKIWRFSYTVPATGVGNYEVQGFIKSGGVWK